MLKKLLSLLVIALLLTSCRTTRVVRRVVINTPENKCSQILIDDNCKEERAI